MTSIDIFILVCTGASFILGVSLILGSISESYTEPYSGAQISYLKSGIGLCIICLIIFICWFISYDERKTTPEIITSGEYNSMQLFDNNSDSVLIEITAVVNDFQVKRVSQYTLTGKDFTENEISETNKALNNLIITMLNTRQLEIDSLRRLYETADNAKNCNLITKDKTIYRLCKVD